MGNTEQLFESLFKRNLSSNDTKDFLTNCTKEYPYFTAAQFYLLQQTETDSPLYNKQTAKTAILFNNPLWLNFQLNQCAASSALPELIVEKQPIDDTIIYSTEIEEVEKIDPVTNELETLLDKKKLIVPAIVVEKDSTDVNEIAPELVETFSASLPEAMAVIEEKITEPEHKDENYNHENIEITEVAKIETEPAKIFSAKLSEAFAATDDQITNRENQDEEYDYEGDDLTEGKEIEPMNIKLDFKSASATTEDTIIFEPLHRSDYFASVGIKLSDEIKPGDKLGKQLKSFTDWLKTMKKIHEEQLPLQNEQSDIIIQKMAEKSNTEGEVLTEAMAEVLLQQGKNRKAIEVYQKLSLLNPSKSAYFAAKIDQIKK